MAVTGFPIIGPFTTTAAVPHSIHDLNVDVPPSQDGVWLNDNRESFADTIFIRGGNGTEKFGLKIGND